MKTVLIFCLVFFTAIIFANCTVGGRSGHLKAAMAAAPSPYVNMKAKELETGTTIYIRIERNLYTKGDSLWVTPINRELWRIDTASNAMLAVITN